MKITRRMRFVAWLNRPAIVCAYCVPMRVIRPGRFLGRLRGRASHGICPDCAAKFHGTRAQLEAR